MTVDAGPAALAQANPPYQSLNVPYISVTVCAPGTSNCQTIDHIEVDTGSEGFRVVSSVLSSSLLAALPQQTTSSGTVNECVPFADGYSFGPVATADLKVGGESAASIPIQLIGGSSSAVPSACSSQVMGQPEEDTVADFGANGVLGVGVFAQDCGDGCAQIADNDLYFVCSSASNCTSVAQPVAQQVSNPVASFATDNNGVALQLPSVGDNGASNVNGTLTFGIGTQSNNAIGNGVVVLTTDDQAFISTTYNGTTYAQSYIDSGSNGYFFVDNSITQCPTGANAVAADFYCPTSALSLSATNMGNSPDGGTLSSPTSTVSFMIGNAAQLFEASADVTALSNLGGPALGVESSMSFDFGLPFFYGRTVYFAIQGASTTQGVGPYYAY